MYVNGVSSSGIGINNLDSTNAGEVDFAEVLSASETSSDTDLNSIFEAASEKYNIPTRLLKAVAKAESNFDSGATSYCGAMGVMQLMPATAKSLGVSDAYDAEQNIMGGAKYLSQLLDEFDGDMELAVAAYNAGPGNVIKYDGIPPFEETENYVDKVMKYYSDYSDEGQLTENGTVLSDDSGSLQDELSDTENGNKYALLSSMMVLSLQARLFEEMGGNADKNEQNEFSVLNSTYMV